jgi:hypothetical protein
MKPKKSKARTAKTRTRAALDTPSVDMKRIRELVRGASGRIAHVLVAVDSNMSDSDRRQLAQVAQDLRRVLEYLDR